MVRSQCDANILLFTEDPSAIIHGLGTMLHDAIRSWAKVHGLQRIMMANNNGFILTEDHGPKYNRLGTMFYWPIDHHPRSDDRGACSRDFCP